ncbi:hypothetical protein ARMSODRAFT_90510 [Armillaria solidipes]|uniref:F-box domain-containing protein n=1 Tax=Armillaria solidipes TaxID=1076256 RepID=A0A2H3BXE4_9AGAR|nr:hypothetical protein ARMSODRAFT_90510 [Armillaria solidipes]
MPPSVVSPGIFSSKSSISFATLGGGILKRTASQEYIMSLDLSGLLWVLGRVCGLWRDTLHISPVSWARNVKVAPPFSQHASEVLQIYLERTGEHPLNLRVVYYDDNGAADNKEIISLIIQSCYRWKNVYLCTHPHYLRSISHLPFLQTINLYTIDDDSDYRLDTFLNSPQLWRATILSQGTLRLSPTMTHYSGYIDCEEDLHLLSHLSRLRTCYLRLRGPSVKFRFQAPVVLAELRHLYVDIADTQRPNCTSPHQFDHFRIHVTRISIYQSFPASIGMPSRKFELQYVDANVRLGATDLDWRYAFIGGMSHHLPP